LTRGEPRPTSTGIVRLVPFLTADNRDLLLERATHRSKREIEEILADMFPRPDAPARMRKLPAPRITTLSPSGVTASPTLELVPDGVEKSNTLVPVAPSLGVPLSPPALVVPIAPARYKVQFTATADLYDKLERLKDLMRAKEGRRCPARAWLEYHHRYPFAFGGESSQGNLVLLCRAHHRLQSEHDHGSRSWRGKRGPRDRASRSVGGEGTVRA
jgi:hypothetical protein